MTLPVTANRARLRAGVVLWLAPALALAAPPDTGTSLLQMTLSLVLVLALLIGTLFLLRRLGIGQAAIGGETLKVVASVAVGPRERVVVVEFGGEWLVLGVAPGAVRLLQSRPAGVAGESPVAAAAPFAASLMAVLRRRP